MSDQLTGNLEENVLCLLAFSDTAAPIIINSVTAHTFGSTVLRKIAEKAVSFFEEFNCPAKEHLPDLLEEELKSSDISLAKLYSQVLLNIYENKDKVNEEFVLSRLNTFIRKQALTQALIEASRLIDTNETEKAELLLNRTLSNKLISFDIGLDFRDDNQVLLPFQKSDESSDFIYLGIDELDRREICPTNKELFTFIAPSNKGKSWFGIHCGIASLIQGKNVLHVSLEMSEDRLDMRYLMALFAITKTDELVKIPYFNKSDKGEYTSIGYKDIEKLWTLSTPGIVDYVKSKLATVRNRNLILKEFPTSSLTVDGLKAYLESLIRVHNFHPDIIFLDDPDNMSLDINQLRLDIGRVYRQLRGIAMEYNLAMVVVSQVNRAGMKARWIDEQSIAQDITKFWTSDCLISFNQTDLEYEKNLARLFVLKNRNDKKLEKILISQNYASGQFCLDSAMMTDRYFEQENIS